MIPATREEVIEVMARAICEREARARMCRVTAFQLAVTDEHRTTARAALTALEAAGVVCVPGEATEGQIIDGAFMSPGIGNDALNQALRVYTAMLAASPYRKAP